MVRWLEAELKARQPDELFAQLDKRLEDYDWSLRKHGLKAATGALSVLLEPKFLGTATAAVGAAPFAGGSAWAALAGATVAIGKAATSVTNTYVDGVDEQRSANHEIAYVHEVKRRLS